MALVREVIRCAISSGSIFSVSGDTSAKTGVAPWFQLYMLKDRGYMRELLARVKAQGSPVLVFTVDLPIPGARYRDEGREIAEVRRHCSPYRTTCAD